MIQIGVERIADLLRGCSDELTASGKADREVAAAEELLMRMIGREKKRLKWEYGPQGKPSIPELMPLQFNLAHSGTLAACAVANGCIGVDLERIAPPRESILRRFFLPWERQLVDKADDPARMFAALWTVREAVCKWDGQGLGFYRRIQNYSLKTDACGCLWTWADGAPCCRVEIYAMDEYMLSVAADGECFDSCGSVESCDKINVWKIKLPDDFKAEIQEEIL